MTFTMPDFRRIEPQESSPYNSLIQNALKNYQGMMEAKYKEPGLKADIFAKEFMPLAQYSTSPLAQAMIGTPQAQEMQNLMFNVMRMLNPHGGMGAGTGGVGAGASGGAAGNEGMPNQGGMGNTTADMIRQRKMQELTKEQVPAGTIYGEDGSLKISPSSKTRELTQNAIVGSKTTKDITNNLIKEIGKLKDDKSLLGYIQNYSLGLEATKLPYVTQTAAALVPRNLEIFQNKLAASLVKNHDYSPQAAYTVAHKGINESLNHYRHRLVDELKEIDRREKRLTSYSSKGVPLGKNEAAEEESPSAEFYFELPSGESGFMPANKMKEFKKAYPNAKID